MLTRLSRDLSEALTLGVAASSCVVRIFMILAHRNAWHGYAASTYHGFYLNLDEAKNGVEAGRTRGSSWSIKELPACAFMGDHHSLLVTQLNSKRPLGSNPTHHDRVKPFLGNIARSLFFSERFTTEARDLAASDGLYREHWADFQRGWPTRWRSKEAEMDDSGVRELVRTHGRSLVECAFLGVIYETTKDGFRVTGIHERSPLTADGLLVGDEVESLDVAGSAAAHPAKAIDSICPGDALSLRVRRGNETLVIQHRAASFRDVFASE